MSFADPAFALFIGFLLILYYMPALRPLQLSTLLSGSVMFYFINEPVLTLLMVFSAILNGTVTYCAVHSRSQRSRLAWSISGVVANLLLLGFFKYKGLLFDLASLAEGRSFAETVLLLPLPIGISFYTFQGISLIVDALRREPVAPDLEGATFSEFMVRSMFFISFFPHSVSGPIVKAREFFPQICPKSFSGIPLGQCLRLLIVGYFLKLVVANNLQHVTAAIRYPDFEPYSSVTLLSLLYAYSIQIFADFAGYSLIALGLALLFGYRLPQNFNFPYLADSFSEFWHRWHMSLSSWLRNYLFIPLGGSRCSKVRTYANLFIVMFLGGLWHGAAWSFAAWGCWHGLALAIERPLLTTRFYRSRSLALISLRVALVFTYVSFGWLLFKLTDFAHFTVYLKAIYTQWNGVTAKQWIVSIVLFSVPVVLYHAWHLARPRLDRFVGLRSAAYGLMVFALIVQGSGGESFIYFQF
jgi:alginate O-acetyltransferase complex protein AlgI